ncbi:MAG: xanthine dehydrogenase family protein subunit M [Hyphomicrobiales bacterium]|nr:xanthine dehydrogenase family protein subunit M [Hyphomicrobiales bacterium]
MKPASFEYHAPTSIDEALALLHRHGSDARLLAGGQSLIPMMNFRLVTPGTVIDLGRIPHLAYIEQDAAVIRIGAMTRQRALEFSPLIARCLPLLREAIGLVGHLPTRARGTIGGSIAHADPAAEIPMVLQALDGTVIVRGPKGERSIAAEDLFRDALTTSLAPDEILIEVRLPAMSASAGFAVEEFSRRHGDFAIAAVAVTCERINASSAKVRIATAGVMPRSTRLRAAEQVLESDGLSEATLARAAGRAAELVDPMSDQVASAEYRRHLTRVLCHRALLRAAAAAA